MIGWCFISWFKILVLDVRLLKKSLNVIAEWWIKSMIWNQVCILHTSWELYHLTSFTLSFVLLPFRWCNGVNPDLHRWAGQSTKRRNGCLYAALAVGECMGRGWVLLHPWVPAPWEVPVLPATPVRSLGASSLCAPKLHPALEAGVPQAGGIGRKKGTLISACLVFAECRDWHSFPFSCFTASKHYKNALKWE